MGWAQREQMTPPAATMGTHRARSFWCWPPYMVVCLRRSQGGQRVLLVRALQSRQRRMVIMSAEKREVACLGQCLTRAAL
jgi:hypothetical protein